MANQLLSSINLLDNPFEFLQIPIRTVLGNDQNLWFCAKDVCLSLDISWSGSGKTLQSIPDEWVGVGSYTTPSGIQEMVFISEFGVYKLAFRSNKSRADEFVNWVCKEVLPAIRKTGGYGRASYGDQIAIHKALHGFTDDYLKTTNKARRTMLMASMQSLANAAGIKLPELQQFAQKVDQSDIFED